ncbi:MAG: copper transporter [Actinomycetes bacterium]
MINFRFHVVSIVAVFLALALGVVVGSTVVDRAIVSSLRTRIDRVERNADEQRAENEALRTELGQRNATIAAASPFAVTGRLIGTSVAILVEPGVAAEAVDDLVALSRTAGSPVGGVLEISATWDDDSRSDALRAATGVEVRGPRRVRSAAWEVLARRIAEGVAADPADDVLARLDDAGFVSYRGVGDVPASAPSFPSAWPGAGARAVYVVRPDRDPAAVQAARTANRAAALAEAGVETTAAEDHRDADGVPARGSVLANVRDDEALRDRLSTVDDLDLVDGRIATVLATADLGRDVTGRYGFGAGAEAPMPAWWVP